MIINAFVINIADELEMYNDCALVLKAYYNIKTWTWGLKCIEATCENDNDETVVVSTELINKALASVDAGIEEDDLSKLAFMELASEALDATLERM